METRISGRYLLIPLLYTVFIFTMLFLAFSGEVSISESSAGFRITGKAATGGGGPSSGALSLRVEFNGIFCEFDADRTMEILGSGGSPNKVALSGYDIMPSGVAVRFSGGVTVEFARDRTRDDISLVTPIIPGEPGAVTAVVIPYSLRGGASLTRTENLPAALLSAGTGRGDYFLTLPIGSTVDGGGRRIVIASEPSGIGSISLIPRTLDGEDPRSFWFRTTVEEIPDAAFAGILNRYISRAYSGWLGSRFNASTGTWRMPAGGPVFSEEIGAAVIAESLARGEYASVYPRIRTAALLHPAETSFLSAPFLGDVVASTTALQREDAEKIDRIRRLLADRDPAIFAVPDVLRFTIDRSPFSLAQEFLAFASSVDLDGIPIQAAVGMLETLISAAEFGGETEQALSRFETLVSERIIPSVVPADSGLLLLTADGRSDLELGLRAGMILSLADITDPDGIARLVGRKLVSTALGLADGTGILPSSVTIVTGGPDTLSGTLLPEDIYRSISRNPYYPREVSLYRILEPGAWMWTAAEIDSIVSGQTSYRVRIRFPADGTHHLVLQGIKPFASIEMFDTEWKTDPQFQNYYSGWFYNRSTETLYMKIRHRTELEDIVFRY